MTVRRPYALTAVHLSGGVGGDRESKHNGNLTGAFAIGGAGACPPTEESTAGHRQKRALPSGATSSEDFGYGGIPPDVPKVKAYSPRST